MKYCYLILLTAAQIASYPLTALATSVSEADRLVQEAVRLLHDDSRKNRTASAERLLQEALIVSPRHLPALWELASLEMGRLTNVSMEVRAERLTSLGEVMKTVIELAENSRDRALANYIKGRYAAAYRNYERALTEYDLAIRKDPGNTKYQYMRALTLSEYGDWVDDNKRIDDGVEAMIAIYDKHSSDPDLPTQRVLKKHDFNVAWALSKMEFPPWERIATHYRQYLKNHPSPGMTPAFAWNNISIAYLRMGDCLLAKGAAVNALAIMSFGAAKENLAKADLCLKLSDADQL